MAQLHIAEDRVIKITWGMMGVVLSAIVAFSIWIATIDATSAAHTEDIAVIHEDVKSMKDVIISIDKKLATIEGYVRAKEN